jgi:CRISPR/Cas system-associated exonuclease Cas4 (RecB family)
MIKSWSYSTLTGYELCAHAYMYRKVVKLPEPPSFYMQKGNATHKLAEEFLLGKLPHLPGVLNKFKNEFEQLKANGAIPEEAIVLDSNWRLVESNDPWMDPLAWLRLKLDARIGNYIVDFKTGRQYDTHKSQAKLYANVHMKLHPSIDEVDTEMWYLDTGEVQSWTFRREELDADIADWERRVEIMHNDTTFEPTPHKYCGNCYVKHLCTAYN